MDCLLCVLSHLSDLSWYVSDEKEALEYGYSGRVLRQGLNHSAHTHRYLYHEEEGSDNLDEPSGGYSIYTYIMIYVAIYGRPTTMTSAMCTCSGDYRARRFAVQSADYCMPACRAVSRRVYAVNAT